MRLGPYGEIILSKRNLLALLSKVDDPASAKTIHKYIPTTGEAPHVEHIVVVAEPDEEHYQHTFLSAPGKMSEKTEKFIEEHSK